MANPLDANDYCGLISIEDKAVVTSGGYQRFFEENGKKYHHIIDPNTLFPSENFLSVSVLCESSAIADALSTALFSMTLQEGKALINSLENIEAMWVLPDGKQEYSKAFKNYLV